MVSMLTDKGIVRNHNEDYCLYYESDDYNIYVVCDGMGGHKAGEIASELTSKGVIKYINENFSEEDSEEVLKNAIRKANCDVYNMAAENESLSGMGTTITACLELNDRVIVANVGDSSSYAINNERIKKITKDHSLVQELVDMGTITEEQAITHPKKNIITRAIGTHRHVDVDIFIVEKDVYNLFMLCTDGLTNEVNIDSIYEILSKEKNLEIACDKLVDKARENGGRDNIAVLLFGGEKDDR